MRVQLRTLLVLMVVLVLGAPAAAQAGWEDVLRDCARDGKLDKKYTQKQLRDAERNLPSDIDEYTDCRSAIRAAMGGGNGKGGPASGIVTASGAIAGSPADIAAFQGLAHRAFKGKRNPVLVGGKELLPGNAGLTGVFGGLAGANGMPTSLMLAIAALLILAAITAYLAVREKVPLVRRAALRIFGR
jgi:hypothetical protein